MQAKTRLLIVDDDPSLRQLLKMYFEQKEQYEVLEAENARAGLDAAAKDQPQLIVVDLVMPRMSGTDFIAALRGHPDTRHIPVLVCSARQSLVETVQCLRNGANGFIPKPIDLTEFSRKIKELLGHPTA